MNKPIKANSLLKTLAYNIAVHTARYSLRRPIAPIWNRLYRRLVKWNTPVITQIHGHRVVLNSGYTYPLFIRRYPSLNYPLLELVHRAHEALGRPLVFVDIGAAVGDTVLLIDTLCSGMVSQYICVDGDPEFFSYLEHNVGHLRNVICVNKLLSHSGRLERNLVRTHGGTASAQGDHLVVAEPLDDVIGDGVIDVLKIDVDGFDGEVLGGAQRLLSKHQPFVIFEWHPILCEQTKNSDLRHFEHLSAAGYKKLVWFNKYGQFSHFSDLNTDSISRLSEFCRATKFFPDWHYDVVAIPENSRIDWLSLADLRFARTQKLY